jgi:hypothetical protein
MKFLNYQATVIVALIITLFITIYFNKETFLSQWLPGGVKRIGNPAYPISIPETNTNENKLWMNESEVYEEAFWKWVKTQREQVKERRKNPTAPNGLPWATPARYPHGTLDRTFREDLDRVATLYWDEATRQSGAQPGDSVKNNIEWSPFLRSFDWLRTESAWVADTNPISPWKCYGLEGFVQDRMHFISYRVWLVLWVRWDHDLSGEPETNIPGTYYIGYPTPSQASRRTNLPLPTEVIPTANEVLRVRPPVEAVPQEIRLWGLWILDSTLTLDTHPLYTRHGLPPKIQYPWPLPGWQDSSLESSTPPRKELLDSTPWGEPAVVANQWIVPKGIPQEESQEGSRPRGEVPSWTWDDWGISPEIPRENLSCPWQTYALRPIPLRPADTPNKAALPRDVGAYTWMFDAARGVSQTPHGQGTV